MLEAMKMENVLRAERDGVVEDIRDRARRHGRRRPGADRVRLSPPRLELDRRRARHVASTAVTARSGSMQLRSKAAACAAGALSDRAARRAHADYCHCRMCQRAAGAPVVAWLTLARAAFRLDRGRARGLSLLARRRASVLPGLRHPARVSRDRRARPPRRHAREPRRPGRVAPGHHIWTASRIAWFETADDLPRYSGARAGRPGLSPPARPAAARQRNPRDAPDTVRRLYLPKRFRSNDLSTRGGKVGSTVGARRPGAVQAEPSIGRQARRREWS